MKTVAFHTLGCKVNQYDSQSLAGMFLDRGYQVVPFEDPADVYVVNTCTVTNIGDRKSRQMIRRAVRTNPDGIVVVTGCYAQVASEEVSAIEGVDLVVGTAGRESLVDAVEDLAEQRGLRNLVGNIEEANYFEEIPASGQGRTRAYIKVQEGCRDFCTYCIVPYARGPLRSCPADGVIEQARRLIESGFRELILTGTHLGAYGRDCPAEGTLADLVARLAVIPGLARLRLSSVEPADIEPELIDVLAKHDTVCPHLHIPLQSGSDSVLERMGRRYDTADFALLVDAARRTVRDLSVTTDVMVGFPGETAEEFDQSLRFVEEIVFAGLHVFKYSPRKGTPAADYPDQISGAEKENRSRKMIALGKRLKTEFASRYVEKAVEVLAEETVGEGLWTGYTPNYIRTVGNGQGEYEGKIIKVAVKRVEQGNLKGIIYD
ncbi:MAG: tRNA (N(6)-L-threonylcarbamoyladenosine(37)-C(2))-methylthiotransferase MtaB [Clostridia bacterium]|nr:tRNA (N(6)-L-threonylcarbamoyladenosine(37)-C(2))-methylthiotransferase MtaB [Clostridia bacterium]